MTTTNILFDRKFAGCPLLATMRDEARDRIVKIFYINQVGLVGVYDGIDTWISPVKGCFHQLKEGLLESQMLLAAGGSLQPELRPRHTFKKNTSIVILKRRSVNVS